MKYVVGAILKGHILTLKSSWTECKEYKWMLGSRNRPNLNMILLTESQWPVRMGEERSPSAMLRKVTRVRTPVRPSTLKALCLPFLMGSSACLRDQTQVLCQLHMVRTSFGLLCSVLYVCSRLICSFSKETMDLLFPRRRLSCCSLTACCDIVSWLRQLKPDGGGLTILCLPCCSCPVVSSSLYVLAGNCRDGHFSVGDHCMPCFCFGITKHCQSTGRYRSQITLHFTEEEDFKGTQLIKNSDFSFMFMDLQLERQLLVSS